MVHPWCRLKENVKYATEWSESDRGWMHRYGKSDAHRHNPFDCVHNPQSRGSSSYWISDIQIFIHHLSCKCFMHRRRGWFKNTMSISHLREQGCICTTMQALTVANIPVIRSTIVFRGFRILLTRSLIYAFLFCPGRTTRCLSGSCFSLQTNLLS